jgi:putative membrane protein
MYRIIKPSLLLSAVIAMSGFLVVAQEAGQSTASKSGSEASSSAKVSDHSFMKEAADGGLAEVELGQLAGEKSSNPQVKEFGQRMASDHGKANEQLKQIASQKGVTLPTEPSAKHKATKERLSKMSGDEFDKAYMSAMLKDHKKDVAAFQQESEKGKDPDVKNFAAQTLPTLQDHLKHAQSIAPKVQSASNTSASPK